MRRPRRFERRLAALAAGIVAGSVFATLALAQPRGHAAARPAPKPAPSADTPSDDKSRPPPAPSPSTATGVPAPAADAGPVPAPAEGADGGKLSPLNPAANELSDAGSAAPSVDYDRLLADIAALRARIAAVSDTLFHSRIAIAVETSGDHGRVAAMSVSLDDGVVWTSPPTFRAEDTTTIYEHAVAPGNHAVTVDVERRDDRNDTFRSSQRSRFTVDVPVDQRLTIDLRLWDDSSMGGDFPGDRKGQYELRVRARAKAQPIGK